MDCVATPEDHAFRQSVELCEFPIADFGHRAHLRLAYVYLVSSEADEAVRLMRSALVAYLDHNGVDASKFHETLTRAWILAVAHFMEHAGPTGSADDFIDQNADLLDSKIMMTHYSADLLFSDEARTSFVEPDVSEIPRYGLRGG